MYATRVAMVEQFGERDVIALTDRSNTGLIDDTVLDKACARANSEVDSYLAARYETPLINPSEVLVGAACDIARYRLCSSDGVSLTEEIAERYKDALKFFERAAKGLVTLGTPGGNDPGTSNSIHFVNGGDSVFSRQRGAF